MSEVPSKKREEPKVAPPLVHRGVVYEAVLEAEPSWGADPLPSTADGCIVAKDVASGAELWRAKLYRIDYDDEKERDKQDVYIERLSLNLMRTRLVAIDDKRRRFEIDLATHAVTAAKVSR